MPPTEFQKATLDNGVTLVAEKHTHVRALCVGVWVKVGSSFETTAMNGASHFLEHMVFKGTEKRTPLEIATVLESLGGDLNAFTDREFTCFHATVLSEHLDIALDVLSDLVLRPTFPPVELERERKVLLQELSMVEDSPDEWISDIFFSTVWKGEPLGQSIIGNKKTIRGLSRAQLKKFFENYYRGENIIVSVAGNVDFTHLRERVEFYFNEVPSQRTIPLVKSTPRFRSRKKSVEVDSEQLHLLVGYEGTGFRGPFRFDALILSFFLGGGMSSRLFQEIREKAALAYTVDCELVPFADAGIFSIYVAMSRRSISKCLGIIAREIERLKIRELTDLELNMVKGQLKGSILLSADQMETRQESLGRNEIIFGRYVSVDEVIDEIDRVTPQRLLEVANRLFVKEKEAIVTLGKFKGRPEMLSLL